MRVKAEILVLSAGHVARFIRYAERMEVYGPDLGKPHTRAMGEGLFELRIKAAEGMFERPSVKVAYDDLAQEFEFLDEVLKARAESGLTQAEVAARIGTTQSAIARVRCP